MKLFASTILILMASSAHASSTACSSATGSVSFVQRHYEGGAPMPPEMLEEYNRERWTVEGREVPKGLASGTWAARKIISRTRTPMYVTTIYSVPVAVTYRFDAIELPTPSDRIEAQVICESSDYVGPPRP